MDNTGTFYAVNNFTVMLRKSSMTQNVNELHKACLLPFLKDVLSLEGRLRKYVTEKDKKVWNNFISSCFPSLQFESSCTKQEDTMTGNIYVGTANTLPSADRIPALSKVFSIVGSGQVVSDRVTGNFFWIAVPATMALSSVDNLNFRGDYIALEKFTRLSVVIDSAPYNIYYTKSVIPLMSTYNITIN